jgi:tripartite-type tricarboxylate transporter receptor subunit TctC
MRMRIKLLRLVALAAIGLGPAVLTTGPSNAQTYPDRPIRFFVPFPAGGSTDAVARALGPALEKILGQTVVVENRAGAGGMLGVDMIAKAGQGPGADQPRRRIPVRPDRAAGA